MSRANLAIAYANRGAAYSNQGDYDRTIADETRAIALDPRNALAYLNRGEFFGEVSVLLGEPPLFPRHEEVELSWKILDPVERFWARKGARPQQYAAGGWGPASADEMLRRDGREWRLP